MKIKAAVFDLDHTLFDRYATFRAIKNIIYENLKGYVSEEYTADSFAELLCEIDKKYIMYEWDEVIRQLELCGAFAKKPNDFYNLAIKPGFMQTAVPYGFTIPTLKKLKDMGIKCGLITNGSSEIQRAKINMLGIEEYFDEIVIGGEIGENKPNPMPFIVFAERVGINPSEMLYIGDNPINDVEGSRNVGYVPVWVKTCGVWDDLIKRADFEVKTVESVPSLIIKLI